ncbi:MAG: hypothetical protein AB7E67_01000 [Xanthobacteraceae bacterium]
MDVSAEALKVARMRIGIEDEKTSLLVHRRVLLDRKRVNRRFFSRRDAEMLDFVERRIRFCNFRLYLLGGPPLHRKAGFDPNQPRVPAGNSDGGQWTDTGVATTFSAAKAKGHHFVPRSLFEKLPLSSEARRVFEGGSTGHLRSGPHQWSKEHRLYNEAVTEHFEKFLRQRNLRADSVTADHAKEFLNDVRQSRDPRIRDYNLRIFRQEFQYYLRRLPRRSE